MRYAFGLIVFLAITAIAFAMGVMWQSGSCYKEECSQISELAPVWAIILAFFPAFFISKKYINWDQEKSYRAPIVLTMLTIVIWFYFTAYA